MTFPELTLSEPQRRVLAAWAADCAERTLPLFERHAPGDLRPRQAIDGLRAFARGGQHACQALAAAAHAAARTVTDPAAVAAARAAGHAAAVAQTGSHARGVIYAAKAAADPDEELDWQAAHASPGGPGDPARPAVAGGRLARRPPARPAAAQLVANRRAPSSRPPWRIATTSLA